MAVEAGAPVPDPIGLGSPSWGGFDARRTRGLGLRDMWRTFSTAANLGWQMEANWTDPVLFFIYSVAKPVSAALILVVMLDIISGGAQPAYRAFVVVGTALWSFVLAGMAGLAWSVLDDRERYRMLKYVYVSPSDFLVVLLGRGVARIAVGAMGAIITIAIGVIALGLTFDLAAVDWLLLAVVMVLGIGSIIAIGVLLAAICLQTRQESWSYPDALAGALFLVSGAVFPLSVLPDAPAGGRAPRPADLVDRRRAPGGLPDRAVRDRRRGQPVDDRHRNIAARRRDDRHRLARDWSARYTRRHRDLPSQRTSRQGSRVAGPDHRFLTGGSTRMRIYEASPRQDFEEVFRSHRRVHRPARDEGRPARGGAGRIHRPGPGHLRRRPAGPGATRWGRWSRRR